MVHYDSFTDSLPHPLTKYHLKRENSKPGVPALDRFRRLCGGRLNTVPQSLHALSYVDEHQLAILFDWMCDARQHFHLQGEVLALAIYLVRRYTESRPVEPRELQLVGCAAVWLASKTVDYERPYGREMLQFVNNTYTIGELKCMERQILESVAFQLDHVTEWTFRMLLTRACTESLQGISDVQVHMADYLLWIAVTSAQALGFHPALLTIGTHVAAAYILHGHVPESVQSIIDDDIRTNSTAQAQLQACVQVLLQRAFTYTADAKVNSSKRSLALLHRSDRLSRVATILDSSNLTRKSLPYITHAPAQFAFAN